MRYIKIELIILSVLCLISGIGMAGTNKVVKITTNNLQKTTITADQMTYDYKRSIAVFQDNVVVIDPQVQLVADTLTVLFDNTNDIKSITAIGDVHIKSEDKTASCNKAIYIASTGEILLTGNAKLTRGEDTLEGKRITFWLNEEKVLCTPGRLVVHSEKNRSKKDLLKNHKK